MKRKLTPIFILLLLVTLACSPCGLLGGEGEEPTSTSVPTNPPAPTVTPTSTHTPAPTATPTASPTPEVTLGEEHRSAEGGFAFLTIPGYLIEEYGGFVYMSAPDASPNVGPTILLIGSLEEEGTTTEQLYEQIVQDFAGGQDVKVELSNKREVSFGGITGLAADVSGTVDEQEVNARFVVSMVTPTQSFTMFGAAPVAQWTELAPLFDAVLASVQFFEPVAESLPSITEPEPTADATGEPLTVETLRGYRRESGTLCIVGLLINRSDQAVSGVKIEIQVLDAAGDVLYTGTTWPVLHHLAPGETSPFGQVIYEKLSGVDSFAARVTDWYEVTIERPPAEVQRVLRTIDQDGNVHLTGGIVNTGSEPIAIKSIGGATFDDDGEIVTANSALIAVRYLAPGESGPFRVYMYGPADRGADAIVDQSIYLDAEATAVREERAITFSEDSHVYVDKYGGVHLVGTVTNADRRTLSILLLAAFYDAYGNVLDADTFSVPVDLAPGESLPFDIVGGWGPLEEDASLLDKVTSYTVAWDRAWPSSAVYIDLETANDEQTFKKQRAVFSGQVVNSSDTAVDKTYVIVALHDATTGELVATGYDLIFDDIPAGESADYKVVINLEPGYDASSCDISSIVKGKLP